MLCYVGTIGSISFCTLSILVAQYTALFSMRLALRGGPHAVENTVVCMLSDVKQIIIIVIPLKIAIGANCQRRIQAIAPAADDWN